MVRFCLVSVCERERVVEGSMLDVCVGVLGGVKMSHRLVHSGLTD